MRRFENNYKEERLTGKSTIYPVSKFININHMEEALSICKIIVNCFEGSFGGRNLRKKSRGKGTGSFIKFKGGDKFQYFLMTCEHVIQKEIIEKDNEEIELLYHLEKINNKITLNRNKRFIKEYRSDYGIDVTIVEIFQEEVPWQYFLEPEYSCLNGFSQYKGKDIIIHQFPRGLEQSYSEYIIDKCIGKKMLYKASTQRGSSGSPIILKDSQNILAVHHGMDEIYIDYNAAYFISDIINDEERINYRGYRAELNKAINSDTNKQLLKQKDKYRYIFRKSQYAIKLFYKEKDNFLKFSIENTNTHKLYAYTEQIKNTYNINKNIDIIQEQFDLLEQIIYEGEIIEKPGQSISIIHNNRVVITLKSNPQLNYDNKLDVSSYPLRKKYTSMAPNKSIRYIGDIEQKIVPNRQLTKMPCDFYIDEEKKILSQFLKISFGPYYNIISNLSMKFRNMNIANGINNYEREDIFGNVNNYEEDQKIEDKQTKEESYKKQETSDGCFIY